MIHAVIIDDEIGGRETLQNLLRTHCPQVKVVGMAHSAKEGMRAINSYDPDLVFLDIEMPHENGFDMLEKLGDIGFEVIFTTAYDHYAIRAIKFSALDYLLKPVDEDELIKAVNKAGTKIKNGKPMQKQFDVLLSNLNPVAKKPHSIALPDATGLVFVLVDNIIRLESNGNQTFFFLSNSPKIVVHKALKEYEELLGTDFLRIHQSHIVNLRHCKKYVKGDGGEIIMGDGSAVELSRRKKEEFLKRFSAS